MLFEENNFFSSKVILGVKNVIHGSGRFLMAANNIVKFFQKVLVVYQIASVVCHYQLRMSTLESRTSFMDQEVSLKVTKRKWFMHIKLLLYLKTKQLVWSTSVHDIILGGRNVLHGSGRFLIANIKCKTFFFKTDRCCT